MEKKKNDSVVVAIMTKMGELLDYLEDNYTYYNNYGEDTFLHNDFLELLDCVLTKDTIQAIELIKKLCDKEKF